MLIAGPFIESEITSLCVIISRCEFVIAPEFFRFATFVLLLLLLLFRIVVSGVSWDAGGTFAEEEEEEEEVVEVVEVEKRGAERDGLELLERVGVLLGRA